jgi:tetratricopeptide (TPR) repeat protein
VPPAPPDGAPGSAGAELSPERLLPEDDARAYRRFLEWSVGHGFKLAVVEIADARKRDALVAWTVTTTPGTRTVRLDLASHEPLRTLIEAVTEQSRDVSVLVLTHLEEATDRRRVCAQLNVQRDELVRTFPVPWIVLVHPDAAIDLQRHAPDFSDFAGLWLRDDATPAVSVASDIAGREQIQSMRSVVPDGGGAPTGLLGQAQAAVDAGRFDEARDLLAQHDIAHPEAAGSAERLRIEGLFLLEMGRMTEAAARFTDALRIHEANDNERSVAATLNNLASALSARGASAGARALLERSLSIQRKIFGTEEHPAVAASLSVLGDVLRAQGNLEGARRSFEQALELRQRLAAREPEHTGWQRDVSVSLERLGDVLLEQGNREGARRSFEQALELRQRLAAREPEHTGWQRNVSVSLIRLGDVLRAQGNLEGARRSFEQALELLQRSAAREPEHTGWQRDLSLSLIRLGDVLLEQGNREGARRSFEQALELCQRLAAREPEHTGWQRDLSVSLIRLGDVLFAQGNREGARRSFEQALELLQRLAAREPEHTSWQTDLAIFQAKVAIMLASGSASERAQAVSLLTQAQSTLRRLAADSRLTHVQQHEWLPAIENVLWKYKHEESR